MGLRLEPTLFGFLASYDPEVSHFTSVSKENDELCAKRDQDRRYAAGPERSEIDERLAAALRRA